MEYRIENRVDKVAVEARAARFTTRSIKRETKLEGLKRVLSMIDLTTLEGRDTPGKVKQLCHKAWNLHDALPDLPHVAAVCVYPTQVATAVRALAHTKIHVAAVATYFPSGQSSLQVKLDDTRFAVEEGAHEIDMVISRGKFLAGEYTAVYDEIAAVKEACGKAHLKVILETGELDNYDQVHLASRIAIDAGADFIKTSTGKVQPAATLPVTLVMLEVIREHYYKTGVRIGMKPAGGISNSKLALHYLVMLQETLGADWMTPDLFRFGASSLTNDVLMQLVKQERGFYPGPHYFSMD
jgi:deoxyribose-phosphate aldolase